MIYSTAYDEALSDPLRVTVIATDLSSSRKAVITPPLSVVHHAPHQQQLRAGTDNLPVLSQVAQLGHAGQAGQAPQGSQATHAGMGGMGAQVRAPQAHCDEG